MAAQQVAEVSTVGGAGDLLELPGSSGGWLGQDGSPATLLLTLVLFVFP